MAEDPKAVRDVPGGAPPDVTAPGSRSAMPTTAGSATPATASPAMPDEHVAGTI
ncbi:MAG: hypothetical protein H0X17_21815, partial [Deltaproteobacteria bacterium]|nr:hypothetical protein [Deltaproteobacteria bacterium]